MSAIETFAEVSASALAPGDTLLSPFGFTGQVKSVTESDETHGPIKHWHVIVESDMGGLLPAMLPQEIVADEEATFAVRVYLADEVDFTPEAITGGDEA